MDPKIERAVAELEAEQADLDAVLASLPDEEWLTPTPAEGWDVRDQVSHLADCNEIALDTATGGPRPLNDYVATFASTEDFTLSGCLRGRAMTPAEVLAWFRASAKPLNDHLRTRSADDKIPWGLGFKAPTLATARLMETWAHGLDITEAVGLPPIRTPRLRSVAWLVTNALPYAFLAAKITPPPGTLRVEVTFEGEVWTFGPEDATDRIEGDAFEYCRVGIQRAKREDTSLKAIGPLAEAALTHARAFL
jgi:uncharacterized protein (TIGR03084 family)